MRRRAFLGAAATVTLTAVPAIRRASGAGYRTVLARERSAAWAEGRPLLVMIGQQREWMYRQLNRLRESQDVELLARLALIRFTSASGVEAVGALTGTFLNHVSPVLAVIDGDPPWLVTLEPVSERTFGAAARRHLRAAVQLTPSWLAPRAASLEKAYPYDAQRLRMELALEVPPSPQLTSQLPAIVALEAFRAPSGRRRRLLEALTDPIRLRPAPAPQRPLWTERPLVEPKPVESMTEPECDLGARAFKR
jgi:hypothetical protein